MTLGGGGLGLGPLHFTTALSADLAFNSCDYAFLWLNKSTDMPPAAIF